MNKARTSQENALRSASFVAALLSCFLVVFMNPWGSDLSPDSAHYFAMALDYLRHGLTGIRFENWPPGYPIFLALVHQTFGIPFSQAAIWINGVSVGCVVFVTGRALEESEIFKKHVSLFLSLLIFSGLFFVRIFLESGIGTSAWSEAPFIGFLFLGFYCLSVFRREHEASSALGWSIFFLVLSWATRFIGVFSFGIWILIVGWKGFTRSQNLWRAVLRSMVPLTLSSGIVLFIFQRNRVQFHYYLWTSHRAGHTPFLKGAGEFFRELIKYGELPYVPLNFFYVFLGVLFLGMFFNKTPGTRKVKEGFLSLSWEHLLWGALYGCAIPILMTRYDIYGMNRFVLPAAASFATVLLSGGSSLISPVRTSWVSILWMSGVLGMILAMLGALNRDGRWRGIDSVEQLYSAQSRGGEEFRQFEKWMLSSDTIYWLSEHPQAEFEGQIVSGALPCKTFYLGRLSQSLPFLAAPTVVGSDAQARVLEKKLGPDYRILDRRQFFGRGFWRVQSLRLSAPDPREDEIGLFSMGCEGMD